MVGAHGHPAGVVRDVVDAVRDGLAQFLVEEVVDVDLLRLPLGWYSRPPFLNSPTSSFFFVSTEITG